MDSSLLPYGGIGPGATVWNTQKGEKDTSLACAGVRPVVSLKSTNTPILKSTDDESVISTYEI